MTRPDQSIYVGIVRMVRGVVRMSAYSFDDVILHPFLLHRLTYAPCLQHTPVFDEYVLTLEISIIPFPINCKMPS